MSILHSLKSFLKSWKLRSISLKLSQRNDEGDLDKLIQLIYSEQYLKEFLDESGIKKSMLKDIYNKLLISGAGQFQDGHYVAASSLVYGQTLQYLINHYIDGKFYINNFDDYNSSLFIADRLIRYFQNREVGEIL